MGLMVGRSWMVADSFAAMAMSITTTGTMTIREARAV